MQNLGAAPPLLTQSRRFQVSQLFYSSSSLPPINRSSSVEFVPFFRERDHMGKLLSMSNTARDSSSTPLVQSKLFDEQLQSKLSPQQSKVNRAVQSFFKKIDMEARQLARSQFIPKKIVLKIERVSQNTPGNDYEYDVDSALNQIKVKSKSCKIKQELSTASPTKNTQRQNRLNHKQSINKNESKSGSKQKILRNNSMFTKKSNQMMSKTQNLRKKQPEITSHKKSQSLIGSLKVKLNPEQPQYKRYKQQQQASLKIFEDYEQGHQKFRQKMKASKLIAYNIKKELQLD